jgi:hypothetical protein
MPIQERQRVVEVFCGQESGIFRAIISHANAMGKSGRNTPEQKELSNLLKRLDKLITAMESIGLEEYLNRRQNRWRILTSNLILGIAKGLGTAVGFTILGAVLFLILQRIAMANLPIIGDFIAQIVKIVERRG